MTRIFVGNLPHSATETELRSLFGRFGHVSSVQIKTDRETNRPRGFAFVLMPSVEDADEAIVRLSRTSMNGRQLTINEAHDPSGRPAHSGIGEDHSPKFSLFDALTRD